MRGTNPTIPEIELQSLEQLVLPDNLLCDEAPESLSPDCIQEVEHPYRIESVCGRCEAGVRFCVTTTDDNIRILERLLFNNLRFICTPCSKNLFRHGGSQ